MSYDITVTTLIIGFKTLTLVLGGLITYLAYRAYNRTHSRSLGALALGFGFVTLGTFLAGVVDQLLDAGFQTGLVIESALIAVGFLIIVYSLYTTRP
ncbi:hypothetical protein SAMN05216226_109163 [Halovenus aranensis]|jgi:hypothetical protein|uniref:YapH protein n=1 Tax=Halovenus aranensis TaxID=890420 RepID=A0A1G8WRS2_9EURY|nr:hypothetical protein [Halovenus aranensis]SDJ80766.1 hypothetical protein SAMN05216226_109163 [Halovenus aranensis]